MKRFLILAGLALLLFAETVPAETFLSKQGDSIVGKFIYSNDTTIYIKDMDGNIRTMPVSDLFTKSASVETAFSKDGKVIKDKIIQSNDTAVYIKDESGEIQIVPIKPHYKFKSISFFMNMRIENMLGGNYYEFIKNKLSLAPTNYYTTELGVGFDWYIFKYFGFSLGYSAGGLAAYFTSYADRPRYGTTDKPSSFLLIGNYGSVKLLLIGRQPVFQFSRGALFLKAYAGPSFNYFDYSQDFKTLAERTAGIYGRRVSWPGTATGFGGTAGAGVDFQIWYFDAGIDVNLQYIGLQFPGSSENLNFYDYGLTFRIGVDF